MILGRDIHLHAACFDEISSAVDQLLAAGGDPRRVVFNAHAFPNRVPPGAIVYNWENVDVQVSGSAFADNEIWDFSARNATRWSERRHPVRHVPAGYHPSMERFEPLPWRERDVDVVFAGCMNPRRQRVLEELGRHGLRTMVLSTAYGPERDKMLARARLAVNMLFYEEGTFAVLRSAHCAANRLPVIAEAANEAPPWAYPAPVSYDQTVDACRELLAGGEETLVSTAEEALRRFRLHPLKLPPQPQS